MNNHLFTVREFAERTVVHEGLFGVGSDRCPFHSLISLPAQTRFKDPSALHLDNGRKPLIRSSGRPIRIPAEAPKDFVRRNTVPARESM
jgi:hypothetical protein